MEWLHWVGRGLYTIESFTSEAEQYGVTRRVSLTTLKRMTWGDRVYTIIRIRQKDKSGVVFGYFNVDRIAGVDNPVIDRLLEEGKVEAKLSDGGMSVDRECGSYVTGITMKVNASLEEICEIIQNSDGQNKTMVAGEFVPITPMVRLSDVPFFQGFRDFDGNTFRAQTEATPTSNGLIRLTGMFYDLSPSPSVPTTEGKVTAVENYEQKVAA